MKKSLKRKAFLIISYTLIAGLTCYAQEKTDSFQEDVKTVSGIIKTAYELISGDVGSDRQLKKIKSLYTSNGIISRNTLKDGKPDREVLTLNEFHRGIEDIREYSFYEEEVNREVRIFGSIATVWSTFQIRDSKNGPVVKRGINNMQLHFKDDRWWILSWSWEYEDQGNKIPASFDSY